MGTETQIFAGLPVRDLAEAIDWYAAFFGRPPDEIVGDEVMWQVTETTWLFAAPDEQRVGGGLVTLGVASLEPYLSRWRAAGMTHQPIETYGNGVQHVTILDPDGNSISLAAAPTPEDQTEQAEQTERPQARRGRVLWSFMMSLDGFVAGPHHSMDWMAGGYRAEPGVIEGYIESTGAIIAGRDGWDSPVGHSPWGGAWQGPIFVLTHHPEDADPAENVTFLHRDPADVVQLALAAAGGKDIMVFSPSIGAQLLDLGLIDEIDLHIAPVLLGDGIRLYSRPGGTPTRLSPLAGDPTSTVRVRYRPMS